MIGQKEAVINLVKVAVPSFIVGHDIALIKLTHSQLENIKSVIADSIRNGDIEYSKDRNNYAEVRTYVRGMVMNHLKKARELNGGTAYNPTNTAKPSVESKSLSNINMEILTEDLKSFVKTLV